MPSQGKSPFEDRMSFLKKLFGPGGSHECKEVVLVEHEKAKNKQHVLDKLKEIETLGGEGLMLREPGSFVPSFSDFVEQTPWLTR
jgi:DNA ligase 1